MKFFQYIMQNFIIILWLNNRNVLLTQIYGAFSKFFSNNTNFSNTSINNYYNWYYNLDVLPDIFVFGQVFYTHFVLQILMAGLILYIAVIGVAFLTVKSSFEKSSKLEQSIFKQLSRTANSL